MRNMSFAKTIEQYRNRSKTVTRRQAWWTILPGERFMGVKKGQGLKKGEKVKRMHASEVVTAHGERVSDVTEEDVTKEGFPGKSREWFIEFYCSMHNIKPDDICNRIEFKHLL